MKRFLLVLFCFLALTVCESADAQTFLGLTTQNDSGTSAVSSLAILNTGLAIPSGACIVVSVRSGAATANNNSVSDNVNGAYNKVGETIDSTSGRTVGFFTKSSAAVASGGLTITAAAASSTTLALNGIVYTGASASCASDGFSGAVFTTTASPSSGSITTSLTDVIIGSFGFSTGSTATVSAEGGSFTQRFNDTLGTTNHQHLHTADFIATGAGTFSYAPTLSAATSGVIAVMALAPPSAPTVQAPSISPPGGPVSGTTQLVTIAEATPGAKVCVTTDGSVPTATTPGTCSNGVTYSAPFTVNVPGTVQALGTAVGYVNSAAVTAGYTSSGGGGGGGATGPLIKSSTNSRYFVNPNGTPVILTGSHTWEDLTDYGSPNITNIDFNAYVSFLKAHNQNVTILWKKDLALLCGWQSGLNWRDDFIMPWNRPGPGTASDGKPQWDLTSFNATYFTTLFNRVQQLQQNGIYAVIEIFDGADTTFTRCNNGGGVGDGGPFTDNSQGGLNNINGVDDGYHGGSIGTGMFTMATNNAVSNAEDAYVKHLIDTLNPLPNVIWEISEEQPGASYTGTSSLQFWIPHMLGLIKTYEGGGTWEGTTYTAKTFQHPVGVGAMDVNNVNDSALYALANADWIAPTINSNFANQWPGSVVNTNNQGKVVFNDSDHSYDAATILNPDGSVNNTQARNYIWENIASGAGGVWLMDPYLISLGGSPVRNTCGGTIANQICTSVDTKYDPFRNALGNVQLAMSMVNPVNMTPQGSLSSTGFVLAKNTATNSQYLVYAPSGGTFTVNLSTPTTPLSVTWFNTSTGVVTQAANVNPGSSAQSFTTPFSGDSVLILSGVTPTTSYLPSTIGWSDLGVSPQSSVGGAGDIFPVDGFGGSGYPFDTNGYQVLYAWSSGAADQVNDRIFFTGGGHSNGCDNGVYSFDPGTPTAFHRAVTGSTGSICTSSETVSNPTGPTSRHTYEGIVTIEHLGLFTITAGCLSDTNCSRSHAQWTLPISNLNPSCYAANQNSQACTAGWTNITASQSGTSLASINITDQPICDYWDLNTILGLDGKPVAPSGNGKEYCWFANASVPNFLQIDYDNHVNTLVGSGSSQPLYYGTTIEQSSGIMIVAGSGLIGGFQLPAGTFVDHSSSSGCSGLINSPYTSMTYDEGAKQPIGWPGSGKTVYIINTNGNNSSTWTCSQESLGSVTPSSSFIGDTGLGAMGRFRYLRRERATVMIPSTNGSSPSSAHAFSYRRGPSSANSFATRCGVAGVVECDPMDTAANTTPFFGDSGGGVGTGVLDTTTFPAGDGTAGSAKLTVPANQGGADLAGNWNKAWAQGFGQNSDIYLQYRFRMDSNMAGYNWAAGSGGGGGHKFSIFHYQTASCAGVELTTQDQFQRGYPQMYTDCGALPFNVDLGNGDFLYEQGNPVDGTTNTNTPYNCHRNFSTPTECATVEAPWATANQAPNQWLTFYYHIHVGTWSTPSSTIQAWFAYEGQNLQPFVNMTNQTILCNEGSCSGSPDQFNHTTFTIYNTGYTGTGNPQASVWYCCQIISTQPIPAPNGPTPGGGVVQVSVPSILPGSSTVSSPVLVSISTPTTGATLCYTTDGTTPTGNGAGSCTHGTTYSGQFSQSFVTSVTIKAIGTESGFTDSSVASAIYTAPTQSVAPGAPGLSLINVQ